MPDSTVPTDDQFARVHERLDSLVASTTAIKGSVVRTEERCVVCQKTLASHDETIHGNGKRGLLVRMEAAEQGRVDTLSVKSVCTLIAAIGALAATIGAAFAALL